ncbi:MAG: site-specific integrase [Leptolyngbyaceae cyanobacterium bins.349]|nr:site-specific integrase [Leptolyngbyaceae cyanobacterium bins.349]
MQIIRAVGYTQHPYISDKDLKKNRIPKDFRLLFTEDMRLVEPVFFFLLERCASAGVMRSKNTQKTYTDHLYEAFSYFEAAVIHWNEVSSDDLRAYSTALHSTISWRTKQLLEPTTISARMRTIVQFYEWAYGEKLTKESMRDRVIYVPVSADSRFLAHISSNNHLVETSSLIPKVQSKDEVSAIGKCDLPKLMHELGPLPPGEGQEITDPRPTRTRLAATISLNAGLRIDEVCGLTKWQALNLKPSLHEPMALVPLYGSVLDMGMGGSQTARPNS